MNDLDLSRIKKVWTANIKGAAPRVDASDGPFVPMRLTITDYGDRAKVEVSGPKAFLIRGMAEGRSKAYRLYGYPQYENPPSWIIDLVSKIGYWTIESGSMS